ncbi:Alpha/Beta hydrolase protein [Umbelopsis sp. PMI_123]|nr:Alpha/Beta hydrolase protein [Umbelopsis sp. PMI_123]
MTLKKLSDEQLDALLALSVPEFRTAFEKLSEPLVKSEPIDIPAKIEDSSFRGPESDIPIRIYTPEGTGPFPAVVYYHGGGWISWSIDTHDNICRYLCVSTGTVIVSVGYRLAPEAKFPAANEDCYAAFLHVHDNANRYNINPERIAVAGDSAGANLAIVTCILSRDRQGPKPKFQCLIYPNCDFTAKGPYKKSDPCEVMPLKLGKYMKDGYLNNVEEEAGHPHASPAKADLHDLPPAFLLTCEKDPLLEEGADFAHKLEASGVPCEYVNALGMDHGCFSLDRREYPAAQKYQEIVFAAIKKALF